MTMIFVDTLKNSSLFSTIFDVISASH